ncbi:MAG TPA: putative transporter small subunit [Candidatus Paenalcaligenes intestinipullorum]|uniref:Transporter small subunit n=1 Tax=Candidatus Paenalcaligenes intestinipullorum TaxID=2838718 RepID=A0A9D2RIE9_9BURK|nr:putative transporter small subunit [Candidatus Paenalcaligenes intestinipullorum]
MTLLTFYILVWPVISAGILILLITALIRDLRAAKRDGNQMV